MNPTILPPAANTSLRKVSIALATEADRPAIYRLRHEVYARELAQHDVRDDASLSDALDPHNLYIKAEIAGSLAGFISITTPSAGRFSIDKYISRDAIPVSINETTYELRILTVAEDHRRSRLAWYLMYAAFRWVEEQKGEHILALGREQVLSLYLSLGAELLGQRVRSGAVDFELIAFSVAQLRRYSQRHHTQFKRFEAQVQWSMPFPFFKAAACFHGGAFFEAVGAGFKTLDRHKSIVNADVLDAWFPPSPGVLATVREHLPWLMKTSPPTMCEGLRDAVAHHRGVPSENILPGAGSSDLIYLAFRQWLHAGSRVLTLDPTYGEYAHVLEEVIGCHVDRIVLSRSNGYQVDLDELALAMQQSYDMVVLVNPNNPTGRHIPRHELERILPAVPARTRVWIDEAYLEYVGPGQSLEAFAAASENVIVCKTMSKVYALSGMRAAYLCAGRHHIAELLPLTPPWAIGLVAQVAAVRALEDHAYYNAQYRQTQALRCAMFQGMPSAGIEDIVPGSANFLLFHLRDDQPLATEVVQIARRAGIFLRDVSTMGQHLGQRVLRLAIKDEASNQRVLATLSDILSCSSSAVRTPMENTSTAQVSRASFANASRNSALPSSLSLYR
jgi:histidinol-phosphate/aromatic aminotransferase/cobyric acid decarboxylase-like protein